MKLVLFLAAAAFGGPLFVPGGTPFDDTDLLPQTAVDQRFVIRERWAKIDMNGLMAAEDRVEFNLFEDAVFDVVVDDVSENEHGYHLWRGSAPAAQWFSSVTLTFKDNFVVGHIQVDGRVFEVRPASGLVKIIEIDQSSFPNESEPVVDEEVAPGEGDGYVWPIIPRTEESGIHLLQSNSIDILHLEPAGTQAGCNNINLGAIESQYQNHMNSVWGSQYGVQSRVMARCLIRNTTNNFSTELSNLRNSGAVAQARNDLRADVVALIIGASGGTCGIAYRPNLPVTQSDQNTAFSVDARSCAIPNWTYVHEFGHNLGLNHDRYMTGGGANQCNFGGFDNYGNPTVRSIMSYNNRCSALGRNCQRLGSYSDGSRLGRTCGGTSTGEDCRRDVLRSYPVVANYR